eukprot:358860-Rhodomonas_salina.1
MAATVQTFNSTRYPSLSPAAALGAADTTPCSPMNHFRILYYRWRYTDRGKNRDLKLLLLVHSTGIIDTGKTHRSESIHADSDSDSSVRNAPSFAGNS